MIVWKKGITTHTLTTANLGATMYPLKIAGRFVALLMFHFSLLVRPNSKQALLYSRFPWTAPVFSFVLILYIKRGYDTKFHIKSKWCIFIINTVNDFEKKIWNKMAWGFFWKKKQAEGTTNLKETIISLFCRYKFRFCLLVVINW